MTAGSIDTRDLALRLRRHVVQMCSSGRSSHVGSALSVADIMAVLYGAVLRVDPKCPQWPDRDRFILSKGHAGAAVYAVLAETGFFPVARLADHYRNGSQMSGHVSHKGVPGVDVSTGALGHGLGIGAGMAWQLRRMNSVARVHVVLSDGDCDEGSTWEAAMFAGHQRLSNMVAVVDYNQLQSLGPVTTTLALEPFVDKWRAFGWHVLRLDGHDHAALAQGFAAAAAHADRPTCLIADTVKGRGVSFMEHSVLWHYRHPQGEELRVALRELGVEIESAEHA
jgi:transketolase